MKIGQLKNIEIKDNSAIISINPAIYSLSAIFSAAYCLCDKAFIMIDGHPAEEILVEIRPKGDCKIQTILEDFSEELINHVVYEVRDERNRELRHNILQKILLANKYEKYKDRLDTAFETKIVDVSKELVDTGEDENEDY